jgi:hypothetical protein
LRQREFTFAVAGFCAGQAFANGCAAAMQRSVPLAVACAAQIMLAVVGFVLAWTWGPNR